MKRSKTSGYIVTGEMGPMFIHRDGYLYTRTRGYRVTVFRERRLAELAIRARRAYSKRRGISGVNMSVHPLAEK